MNTHTRRYLISRAASNPAYWAHALHDSPRPWEALACTRAQWDNLALCVLPRPDHRDADLDATASATGVPWGRLVAILATVGG